MTIVRALPYLLMAVVLGAAGYLAGAVTDPFAPTNASVQGELSPQEPRLRSELEQARGEAAELAGELQRAQTTIDRLRTDLAETRSRIAELQQRAEAAEQARATAQEKIGELAERVAALEARPDAGDSPAPGPALDGTAQASGTPGGASERDGNAGEAGAPANAPARERETGGGNAVAATTEPSQPTAAGAETQNEAETPATVQSSANAAPEGIEADPRPGTDAVSAINPTTRQANRLVAGVQAYQDTAYQEAFRAWLPLAQTGYARAQLHLGALFLEGRGTERNDPLAYAWLTIARDNGSQNAGPLLEQLRDRMSPSDLDAGRRLLARARQTAG